MLRAPSPSPLLTEPKKYEEEDLPWDMNIAYPHPTLDDENISSAADMPHGVKKQVNAIENSGKKSSDRDLHLNGLPVQLRMAYDAYKQSTDHTVEGSITLFPKLGADVFEKTSKSRMRFGLAARAVGQSMANCIESHKDLVERIVEKASPNTYDSYLEVCKMTNRFIDIMNGKCSKGCSSINSPNHPAILSYLIM